MIYIIVIISFLLDGLLSIYQGPTIFDIITFKPMFTIVSLVLIYPLCYKNYQKYYKICLIIGLAYDLIYTNTLMLNMTIFLLLGYITYQFYQYLPASFINTLFINLIIVTVYHLLTFFVLYLIGYLSFNIYNLSSDFFSIILTNTFYLIGSYTIINITNIKSFKKSKYSLYNIK